MTENQILLQNHKILKEVQDLINKNEIISAIKLVNEKSVLGLKKSKEIVESISSLPFIPVDNFNPESYATDLHDEEDLRQRIDELLRQNRKIEAIKAVVDRKGMNLLDAKNLVESIQNGETTFTPEANAHFTNISVKMTNFNGKITVSIKEENGDEKIINPNDPQWEKAKKMLGNKRELLAYEAEFHNGKHPVTRKKSNLFLESNSSGKWILFLVLFCIIMMLIYLFYPKINL